MQIRSKVTRETGNRKKLKRELEALGSLEKLRSLNTSTDDVRLITFVRIF
jgi:hypothetical protein